LIGFIIVSGTTLPINAFASTSVGGTFNTPYLGFSCDLVNWTTLNNPNVQLLRYTANSQTGNTYYNYANSVSGGGGSQGQTCEELFPDGIRFDVGSNMSGRPSGTYYFILLFADDSTPNFWSGTDGVDWNEYYLEFYWDGSAVTDYTPSTPPDTSTRIDAVVPADNSSVATSTPSSVGADGYVSVDDYKDGDILRIFIRNDAQNASQLVGPLFADMQETWVSETFEFYIEASGSFSTTTSFQTSQIGVYSMTTEILRPRFSILGGICFMKRLFQLLLISWWLLLHNLM